MIAYLEGKVLTVRKDRIVVVAGSIGFEVFVLGASKYQRNDEVELFIYQQFKEDGQFLFGFETEEEYELFTLLIQVKGLGCKSVLNMLGAMDCQSIIQAIENSDSATLKKLPGIGAKTAGQIILDLKGKIVIDTTTGQDGKKKPKSPVWAEVSDALLGLGYKQNEINGIELSADQLGSSSVNDLLRYCLKILAKNKRF
ncbi:MAG: Holliday junction branch migration protein RuvA [Allobaculum sp.]